MFCPDCGSLGFVDRTHRISCPNYRCGYQGSAENYVDMPDGSIINTSTVMHHKPGPKNGYDRDGRKLGTILSYSGQQHNGINQAMYQEWRDMKEEWSHGVTRYDVHNYGSGSG